MSFGEEAQQALNRPMHRARRARFSHGDARGCEAAGLALYSSHDLRHRYASVNVREGVPVTDLAAQLGHARKSITLDTYSHVLLES
jgi:integrase